MNHDASSLQRESRRGSVPLPLPIDTRDRLGRIPARRESELLPPLHVGSTVSNGNGGSASPISPAHLGASPGPELDQEADGEGWEGFPALGRALGGIEDPPPAAESSVAQSTSDVSHPMPLEERELDAGGSSSPWELARVLPTALAGPPTFQQVEGSETLDEESRVWEAVLDADPAVYAPTEGLEETGLEETRLEVDGATDPGAAAVAEGTPEIHADAQAEADAATAIVGPPAAGGATAAAGADWRDEEPVLGEAEPEDEIPLAGGGGLALELERLDRIAATGALQGLTPAEPSRLAEVADRLERIARTLREHGTTAPLIAQGRDPLGALITGYVLGYFEGAHTREADRSG